MARIDEWTRCQRVELPLSVRARPSQAGGWFLYRHRYGGGRPSALGRIAMPLQSRCATMPSTI